MRVLVTGATGFVGHHLLRLLLSRGHNVFGTYISAPVEWEFAAKLFSCDVRDAQSIRKVVFEVRPNEIYHLAAQSSPSQSLEQTREVFDTNFWGTYNLLEAARQVVPKARILLVGSAQCYGGVRNRKPLTESAVLSPPNPYALSKAAADMLAGQYYSRFGLHIIRARPFNHTGPGQQLGFVCSDYARRLVSIELGKERPILHIREGGARRDFTDVRDVVRAYKLLMEKGRPGEAYNVASGRSTSVGEIVSILASFCSRPINILQDRKPGRPGEISSLYGSGLKLSRATGWKPRYNMRQTLRDLFDYWKLVSIRGNLNIRTETPPEPQSEFGFRTPGLEREVGNVKRFARVPQRRGN
jgi:GDP-4-dehydro-6-deoxy-D-mannose reductase